MALNKELEDRFNTVNGKYCCNYTNQSLAYVEKIIREFQYRKR